MRIHTQRFENPPRRVSNAIQWGKHAIWTVPDDFDYVDFVIRTLSTGWFELVEVLTDEPPKQFTVSYTEARGFEE